MYDGCWPVYYYRLISDKMNFKIASRYKQGRHFSIFLPGAYTQIFLWGIGLLIRGKGKVKGGGKKFVKNCFSPFFSPGASAPVTPGCSPALGISI